MFAKKRCSVCRKLFQPDPRVGARQHACGAQGCQRHRRARTQASWRARNPTYQSGYRLARRAAAAAAAEHEREPVPGGGGVEGPPLLRMPAVLGRFPWEQARRHLGFAGADLLLSLAVLLVRQIGGVKDQKMAETPLSMGVCAPAARAP